MSVVGLIVVQFIVFLCSGFRSPLSHLLCFITVVLIIFVFTVIFHDEVENPYAERTCISIWICIRIKGEISTKLNGLSQSPVVSYWPFQDCSSDAVLLCFCVCCFVCGVCVVLVCFSSLLLLMPQVSRATWLWHFLDIFTYSFIGPPIWSVYTTSRQSLNEICKNQNKCNTQ